MSFTNPLSLLGALSVAIVAPQLALSQTLQITSFTPARNSLANDPNAPIEVVFDRAVNPATFTSSPFNFHAFGERSGPIAGKFSFLDGDTRVRFTPSDPFTRGERVWVVMSKFLAGADGSLFRTTGHSWQFWVAASPASMTFDVGPILDTTTPGVSPRPYGGQACDFNNDGAVDICIVCEDTSDMRIFLNNDTGGPGDYHPFLQPTFATGSTPSPNEAADFNGDGIADMVTANTATSTISVLMGLGDGRFGPKTDYAMGTGPHGVAVLDVDGDGDIDIATANTQSGNVAVIRNNGAGVFGSRTTFDGGGSGEWAITAGDLNNDGITDLVVGASSGRITVHRGLGNGTFVMGANITNGFGYWMMVCSELNGDGNLDVTAAASYSGACVHMGNGLGGIGPAITFDLNGSIATDTGDLDGDGDLDWILSSFGAGQWYVLENINGVLTLADTFFATNNPACAVLLDYDLDGALDIALIDEISDMIHLLHNTPLCTSDFNNDGTVNSTDVSDFINAWFEDQVNGTLITDWDGNGVINSTDVSEFINDWFEDTAAGCGA